MKKLKSLISIIFLLQVYWVTAQNFGGNPASERWLQINNKTVRVIFPKELNRQANRIANIMKLLGDSTAATIGGKQKKWNIVLLNRTTLSNAYVRQAPVLSEFYMMPPQNSFSTGSLRWDDNLAIHENRHIQQLSNFNKGFTKVFSFLLGQEGQLLANGITIPDYFFEGDAVWQETLVSAQGRGRMPSFYNGFKSLWLESKNYPWMTLRNGSLRKYIPGHYELGYLLTAYGYEKYGQDFWLKVTNDAVRFRGLFYPFNKAIERYSGKSYQQFGQDAMQYFKEKSFKGKAETETAFTFISKEQKNNVADYEFPHFINDDSILVTKKSYKEINAFYILSNNKEKKLRVRDIGIDDYYSYKNGKIVYAAYQSDTRWANRDYSVIKMIDIYTGQQRQVTFKSKFFSPDINDEGTEILAVNVNPDGTCNLCRIDATNGKLILKLKNANNYFITHPKYIDAHMAVAAVRNRQGNMMLMKINLQTGSMNDLTVFSYNVIGYPFVKGDTIYFNIMNENADKVFAYTMANKKLYRVTQNSNGMYAPAVNDKGDLVVSAFNAQGYRIAKITAGQQEWALNKFRLAASDRYFTDSMSTFAATGAIYTLNDSNFEQRPTGSIKNEVTRYRKALHLFNFHSWRPVIDDPEFGYTLYSDNVLSSVNSNITYTYNHTDKSHTIGFAGAYAGWFPVLGVSAEASFNRNIDTAVGKTVSYNAAKARAGLYIPLRFVGGLTNKFLNVGGGYNLEQYYYRGVGKNIFNNKAVHYMDAFLSFSNVSQQARQHINPRWAQALSFNYRKAFGDFSRSHKFVANSAFYFPGLFVNHSLVLNVAYQYRDSFPDLFSKIFSYSRGYEALSTRRMYKLGANYHFPIVYPDWGFANILYFQRIRGNAFFDYTGAKARVNNNLTEIRNRSTGAEIYFDTKVWNALPVSFGVRFSHLLDTDLLHPSVKNRWEIIIPVGFIPN